MNPKLLTLSVLAALNVSAQAATIFSDGFETTTPAGNAVPSGWSVTNGTVDTVGLAYFGNLCNGSGRCVDLDGSTGNAGELSRSFSLLAGNTYLLAFDLAGNRRGAGTETGTVSFGTASLNYSMSTSASTAAYQQFTLAFTPTTSGMYAVKFANFGGDNQGAILDNVSISVSAVPEPQTYVLLALGLAALAVVRRRA